MNDNETKEEGAVKMANYEVEGVVFKSKFAKDFSVENAAKGLNLLVAVAADYDFYWVPMYLHEALLRELRKCGLKYRIFFRGPRPHNVCGTHTRKDDARAFSVYFYEPKKEAK